MTDETEHHLGEDLLDIADGRWPSDRRAALEAHLATCPACQAAVRSAAAVLRLVDGAPAVEPSAEFDRALVERLDRVDREARARGGAPSLLARLQAFFTLPRLGTLSAAAGVAAVTLLSLRGEEPALPAVPAELAANLEGFDYADDLELLKDLEVVEDLDVIEDLEAIEAMDDGEAG